MKFDEIIIHLGEFGRYQQLQYFLICLTSITTAFQTFVNVYVVDTPKVRCHLPEAVWPNDTYAIQSTQHKELIDLFIPIDNSQYNRCFINNVTLSGEYLDEYEAPSNSTSRLKCPNGWVYTKEEFTDTFVSELNLVCDKEIWKVAINQCFAAGMLVGALVFGWISDRYGRKTALLLGVLLQLVPGVIAGLISDPYSMSVCKFLIGASSVFQSAFVLGMEWVGPSKRYHAGIIIEYVFAFGVVLMAGIAYFLRYWRTLQIVISVPAMLFLTFYWLVPESPQWLISKGRREEANKTLRKAARMNKVELPEEAFVSADIAGEKVIKVSILEIFRSRTLVFRFFNIVLQWFVAAMVYYGLSLNSENLPGSIYLTSLLSGLMEFPGYFIVHVFINLIGRKIPHCLSMLICGVACFSTLFLILFGTDVGNAFTALSMVGKCFNTAAFGIIFIWTAELFPTPVRNATVGMASMCGRIGTILAPLLDDLNALVGGRFGRALPLVIFGGVSIVAGLCSILLPETLNRPMPQTFEDVENFTKPEYEIMPESVTDDTSLNPVSSNQPPQDYASTSQEKHSINAHSS